MHCGDCEKELENGAAFCPVCGAPIAENVCQKTSIGRKKAGKLIATIIVIAEKCFMPKTAFFITNFLESLRHEGTVGVN